MIDDPYKVLGLSPGVSEEEIKKAYRRKAKEYHPDLHPNDPEAVRKMNEINEAYDMLQNPEKYRVRQEQQARYRQNTYSNYGGQGGYYNGGDSYSYGQQAGNSQNRGYQNYGGWTSDFGGFDFNFGDIFGFGSTRFDTTPQPQSGDSQELIQAIRAVQGGRFQEAIDILSKMTSTYRNHRWYYVSAAAYKGIGDNSRAQDMIERAIQMNSENRVYRQFRQVVVQSARSETGSYNSGRNVSPFGFFGKIIFGIIAFRLLMGFMQMVFYGLLF